MHEDGPHDFDAYALISISFQVDRVLVHAPDLGPARFREEACPSPFTKDYDRESGGHPTDWPRRFDTSSWTVISARSHGTRVGGIVVVHGSDDVEMLEGRDDLAVIWDIRVAPGERRRGVGAGLVSAAQDWARSRDCTCIKVETQNINAPACRFYERAGFEIRKVDPHAYPDLPDEIQLLWYKTL